MSPWTFWKESRPSLPRPQKVMVECPQLLAYVRETNAHQLGKTYSLSRMKRTISHLQPRQQDQVTLSSSGSKMRWA